MSETAEASTTVPTVSEFILAVHAERARQVEKGYTPEYDREQGPDHLLNWAMDYARRGEPVKSAALIDAARGLLSVKFSRTLTLDDVHETTTVKALVEEAKREGEWCCELGCGGGACETCPCCMAGWCIGGLQALPEEPDDIARWLSVAIEHNPGIALAWTYDFRQGQS